MSKELNIQKICNFYNKNKNTPKNTNSMWDCSIIPHFCSIYLGDFHNNNFEKCNYYLENISKTNLTYGYDAICINGQDSIDVIYKTLNKLITEMNIHPIYTSNNVLDIEELLPLIDIKCGFRVEFPDIYDYSTKSDLICSRGKISNRMLFALYYVYNIKNNVDDVSNSSVLEIGAGTGRTAYYAYKFGFKSYTILDIISTTIVQAHYNFNVLGSENVSLWGDSRNCFLTIIPSSEFDNLTNKYDIIVNFDGLTEYGLDVATKYFNNFYKLTTKFLSINHVYNYYTIEDIYTNNKNCKLIFKEKCDYRIDSPELGYYKELLYFI
jgi:hypothetical protein